MVSASIDLGTNTCLLLIAEIRVDGIYPVDEYAEVIGLGRGVDRSGVLADDAMVRALVCLTEYKNHLTRRGIMPGEVICVATAQARDALNADVFFAQIERSLGFVFRTLPAAEEARSTFKGALLPGFSECTAAVIDIGGGSTEIASVEVQKSIQMGAVRFTERYFSQGFPVSDIDFWACRDAIDQALVTSFPNQNELFSNKEWLAVAGTATSLAQWFLDRPEFDREAIEAVEFTVGDLHRMVEDLKWRTAEETATLPGIGIKRSDVILAGAMILWRTAVYFKPESIRVSTRGLRYGVL